MIDYTPNADVAAGDVVVLGTHVGIANLDIKAGTLGALAIHGVFELPKDDGPIGIGHDVYWDATAQCITATSSASTTLFGTAIETVVAADATVRVLLHW